MPTDRAVRKALVTGGSRGIGAATCRALARDGWTVFINYNQSKNKALALAEEIGGTAVWADVSDPAAVAGMIRAKKGCIINITSVCGVYGSSCEAAYSSTKGAMISMTRSLFKELGPSGIRVNAIAPGVIDTDMTACFSPQEMAAMAADTPLGRIGRPEDIAELAAFLASDRAGFITGEIIGCDGGFRV